MKNLFKVIFAICILATPLVSNAQVTEIWTDYQGFWSSSSTSINSILPDNSHNLLAFRLNGTIYSTNVNNSILDNNGVTGYQNTDFRALPVASLPNVASNAYFVGLGANFDNIPNGVDNSTSFPFQAITNGNEVADFITRGEKGLDLGSALTNIPQGTTSRFNLSSGGITVSNIGDGIPDILISQVAQPSGSDTDNLYFVNSSGAVVGNQVNINLSNNTLFPRVGSWNVDFYNFNSTQTQGQFINTSRDLRFFAVDISAFGISAANSGNAVALIYEPRGSSDPAFLAFNEPSLGVASQISIINQPTESFCDGTLDGNFQVQLEDFNGNSVPQGNIAITAIMESGPGELLGTTTRLTNSLGVATFNDLAFEIGGLHRIRFEYSSLSEVVSNTINPPVCNPLSVWTGNVNSDWNNPGNWLNGNIPNANFNAEIPTGRPNYPILNVNAGVRNIELGDGASVTLNGFLFAITGDVTTGLNPNILACASGSRLYFSGSTNQVIEDGIYNCPVANLTIENPNNVNIEADIDLTESLKLAEGDLVIENTSTFTFKSTALQTAVLSRVNNGANISGCVVVERFIPASNRAFRYIGASVNTTALCGKETIRDNIQEGDNIVDYNSTPVVDPNPGFGTHVTGSSVGANGFDATITGNPSMFSWDENFQQWNPISNSETNTFDIGDSYSVLVRGGRELDLRVNNTQLGSSTTLRFTGNLVYGDFAVNNLASNNDEFSLVANPYQAQVDMQALLSSGNSININNSFMYVYDPNIGLRGGYATVDLSVVNGEAVPSFSAATKFLQPNQSVFIENAADNPSLTFKEIYKRSTSQSFTNAIFSTNESKETIDVSLKRSYNNNFKAVDGIKLKLGEDFSDSVLSSEDAIKLWNSDESMSILKDNHYLSIERRTAPINNESVQLFIWNYKTADYQLSVNTQNLSQRISLKDNYTGEIIELENNTTSTLSFTTDQSISESVSNLRFELIFEEVSLNTNSISEDNISVYPNPASDVLNINIPKIAGEKVQLELYDMSGRLVNSEIIESNTNTISNEAVKVLAPGVYTLNISVNQNTFNKKIIVK